MRIAKYANLYGENMHEAIGYWPEVFSNSLLYRTFLLLNFRLYLDYSRSLVCPECREEMNIESDRGVEMIPPDFKLSKLVDLFKFMKVSSTVGLLSFSRSQPGVLPTNTYGTNLHLHSTLSISIISLFILWSVEASYLPYRLPYPTPRLPSSV